MFLLERHAKPRTIVSWTDDWTRFQIPRERDNATILRFQQVLLSCEGRLPNMKRINTAAIDEILILTNLLRQNPKPQPKQTILLTIAVSRTLQSHYS